MDNPTCDVCQADLATHPVGQQTADTVLCLDCLRRTTGATTTTQVTAEADNPNRTGHPNQQPRTPSG